MQDISFVSTTARLLLNEWRALRSVIHQEVSAEKASVMRMLSDVELYDAFSGPFYPIIRTSTTVYSLLTRLRTRIVITQDDSFSTHVQKTDLGLQEGAYPEVSVALLDKMQKKLDGTVRSCFTGWKEQVVQWQAILLPLLQETEVAFSSPEIEGLQQLETISALQNRFTDLQLKWPSIKGSGYSFVDYFNLKITLCVHSAVHRQHLTNYDALLQQCFKKIKSACKQITQEEKSWMAAQQTSIEEIAKF